MVSALAARSGDAQVLIVWSLVTGCDGVVWDGDEGGREAEGWEAKSMSAGIDLQLMI